MIWMKYDCQPDYISVPASGIDNEALLPMPTSRIFVEQAAPWCKITDELPRYDRFDPEFQHSLDAWMHREC